MASYSQRESVLLGYSPQGALMMNNPSYSPKSSTCQRNSDNIDFSDVFGGPPRRSSRQEIRYSFGYNTDSSVDDETAPVHRQRWSGLGEKPVFGDEVGSRRRYPSEDFFDDIFKGNECLSSSPRKHDNSRDVFGSSPSSRVLSPAFPLPPKAEPFGSHSPPSQFSLSAKLIKGTDMPTFGSSSRNLYENKDGAPTGSAYAYSPLSRSSCQGQAELIRQSSFAGELSFSKEEPSNLTTPDGTDNSNYSQGHSYSSDVATNGKQFHFSFYKWAGKGMPLPIPFRGGNGSKFKEKHKLERCSSANGRIAYETVAREITSAIPIDADSASFMCSAPSDSNSREMELKKQENGSIDNTGNQSRVEQSQSDDTAIPSNTKSETPITLQVIAEDVPVDTIQTSGEGTKANIVPDMVSSGRTEVKTSAVTQEDAKNELKLLRSLFYDHDNEQSIKVTARKSESREIKVKSTKKSSAVYDIGENVMVEDGKVTMLLSEDLHKANLQGSLTNSPDNLGRNRARGKVKEFVKIFDQDASNDTKSDVKSQNLKSVRKERSKFRTEHDARVRKNETKEKMHSPKVNKNSTLAASLEDDEFPNQSEKLCYESKTSKKTSTDIYSGRMDSSNSNSASIPDGPEAIIDDTDETFQVNFLIDDLFQDEDILPQVEEIQDIDAKIRKWSNGKEGNIRSLLSTLQYVLWPGSGWKPVPLVNIIEGNAVKRSYQKALLYLHPDKLQQKGATTQQKYIAERVFDILQEAWTHFNSLGSV